MFCGKCGNEVKENEGFCANCGEPIKNQSATNDNAAYISNTSTASTTGFKLDLKKANLGAVVFSIIMFIMIFFPFGIASCDVLELSIAESLSAGKDGIYFIIIAICGVIAGLLDNKKGIIAIGGIACAVTLFEVINFVDVANEFKNTYGAYYDINLKRGIGFWLMIIASVGLIASPFIGKHSPKE